MFTAYADISHVIPCTLAMPTLKDDLGGGAQQFRRRQTRALRRFELNIADSPERLDQILGLIENCQGDTPFWFDGGPFGSISEPIIIGTGNGSATDFILPHRHVFVSSAIIYVDHGVFTAWTPLGGDGVTMDAIRFDAAVAADAQITGKWERKFKCVFDTDQGVTASSNFIDDDRAKGFSNLQHFVQEVAV